MISNSISTMFQVYVSNQHMFLGLSACRLGRQLGTAAEVSMEHLGTVAFFQIITERPTTTEPENLR